MKTDKQLQQDVSAELKWEPSINAVQIDVQVKDGIVSLQGNVRSYAEKLDAETAARRVAGVKGLLIDIDVKLPRVSRRSDGDIGFSIDRIFSWSTCLQKVDINVMVVNGLVTLSGEVHCDFEKYNAIAVIRHLRGVIDVVDHITIKKKIVPEVVTGILRPHLSVMFKMMHRR